MAVMPQTLSSSEMQKHPFATPLTCPVCSGCITAPTEQVELVCMACDRAFPRSRLDWFYSFYDHAPLQNRSLLSDEEPILNPAMTSFAVAVTTRTICETLLKCRPNTVLDIGCGDGGYSEALSDLYTCYLGLEPSEIPTPKRMRKQPGENVILVHNDPSKPLPVAENSIDLVMFLASYDHIPNRSEAVAQAWNALRPFGFMLITMTNYGFWAKRLLNFFIGREIAKQEHDHFCVHNPKTLANEILSSQRIGEVFWCEADNIYIPNSQATILYGNRFVLTVANRLLRFTLSSLLRQRHSGSTMTVIFRKLPALTSTIAVNELLGDE
jgi:SAM-dependent methyltransferase